jgi:hypothetical protein
MRSSRVRKAIMSNIYGNLKANSWGQSSLCRNPEGSKEVQRANAPAAKRRNRKARHVSAGKAVGTIRSPVRSLCHSLRSSKKVERTITSREAAEQESPARECRVAGSGTSRVPQGTAPALRPRLRQGRHRVATQTQPPPAVQSSAARQLWKSIPRR